MLDNDARHIIDAEIIPKLQTGDLALFLGAGISIGTPCINGLGIPSTSDLIKRICEAAGYPPTEAELTDLPTAFGVGQDDIDNFENFLISNFHSTKIHPWHSDIFKLWWRIVFTTNIDNIPHEALVQNKQHTNKYPDYKIYNYKDTEPVHSLPTSPPLVFLHGNIGSMSDGFVFDSVSYATNTVRQSDWMTKCALHIEYGNCLFVGSKFKESDIEAAIRARSTSDSFNKREQSWIVLRSFTQMERSHYIKKGITPIAAEASDFFDYLKSKVEYISPEKFLKRKAPYLVDAPNRSIGWFTDNFEHVPTRLTQALKQRGPHSRFYMGDLPEWFYIAHKAPATLPAQREIESEIANFLNSEEKCKLIAVTGPLGSGKTTACMMAAAELAKNHVNVHNFYGLNGIEIEHLWNTIKDTRGLFCLVIDAAYEHFYAINAIFERVMNRPIACKFCVIVEERTRQFERNKHHFSSPLNNQICQVKVEKLNLSSASRLYEKSFELGIRFEKLLGKTKQQAVREIIDFDHGYKGDLLATLYDLSSRQSYREKLAEEYQEIENIEAVEVYQTVALVTAARLPLPLNFICESHNLTVPALDRIISEGLRDKIHTHGVSMGISARHHSIAEYHLAYNIPAEQIKVRLINLMKCLAPKFTIQDIKHHPLSYKIYKSTLSFHYLTETLFRGKKNYPHIHEVYSFCQTLFASDGVFWLQYGRFLEKDSDIEGAIHCFRKGLGLYDSFHVRHALGQTLLKQYIKLGLSNRDLYEEGISILQQEIDTRGHNDVYPYTSLGQCLIHILKENPDDAEAFSALKSVVNRGLKHHKADNVFMEVVKDYMKLNPEPTLN
ncbi:SIR2 family protein [Pseudomonas siliginis]|uniref:P-loop NTPase n=1 Tax=Pseudomonas siliginis TaxID=2842346 RepID=UPI003D65DD7C